MVLKKYLLALSLLLSLQVMGAEEQIPSLQPDPSPFLKPSTEEANFFYGSLSLVPGIGISNRKRTDSKGTAVDYKLGVLYVPFDVAHPVPVLAADYNRLHFFRCDQKVLPYVSYGIGVAYIVPYVPLRAGLQHKDGFLDIGAKMVLGIIPSPEIRGGVTLEF